ncbi:hypothetical protein V1478_017784 [Vespula squamosa]|uniref:Uncharacterized protein n=1 Tax=Vespula squamosa TaxID=30214 RepID=A0ABD1ZV71_VESSQ
MIIIRYVIRSNEARSKKIVETDTIGNSTDEFVSACVDSTLLKRQRFVFADSRRLPSRKTSLYRLLGVAMVTCVYTCEHTMLIEILDQRTLQYYYRYIGRFKIYLQNLFCGTPLDSSLSIISHIHSRTINTPIMSEHQKDRSTTCFPQDFYDPYADYSELHHVFLIKYSKEIRTAIINFSVFTFHTSNTVDAFNINQFSFEPISHTKGETNTSQKNSREIAKAGMTRNERDARRTYVTNKYVIREKMIMVYVNLRFILINSSLLCRVHGTSCRLTEEILGGGSINCNLGMPSGLVTLESFTEIGPILQTRIIKIICLTGRPKSHGKLIFKIS